jgi:mRNA-degrading endonuclease RelE of RelBE toxin-antitoxin system
LVSKRAYKFLDKLNGKLRQKILGDISSLENFPFFVKPLDIAKLKGRKGYYRLRTGKIRAIFKIDREAETIYILKIAYREKVYE